MRVIVFLFLTTTLASTTSPVNGETTPCSSRQYRKSGTCIPCTNCHSQGLEILVPCSSLQDELCRVPVYGMTKIYSPPDSSGEATPGPTHRVRQKVLRGGYVRSGGSIEKLRNAYFYRRDDKGGSFGSVDGRIKYEEDENRKKDNLHSDLEAIEQELLREKARENELASFVMSTTSVPVKEPRKKLSKELRRRRKKKNRKNTTSTSATTLSSTTSTTTAQSTTTISSTSEDPVRGQVFGQIIQESSSYETKSLEEPEVIQQILLKEERNYSSRMSGGKRRPSLLRPSKKVFGVSTKTWTIIASLIGAIAFIVICILVGLKKVYSIQTFKLLDNSGNAGSQGSNGQQRPPRDAYVQGLVTSRTSSFHRSTESRLTTTTTVPISPNHSSPSSPKNKHSAEPQSPAKSPSLTYVDSSGRTNIRRDNSAPSSARELPV